MSKTNSDRVWVKAGVYQVVRLINNKKVLIDTSLEPTEKVLAIVNLKDGKLSLSNGF